MAVAAVSRSPGMSEPLMDAIPDFYTTSGKTQALKASTFWKIYKNEGLINNAVNKIAAVLSTGGSFKVRYAKRGKSQKAIPDLMEILNYWMSNVNQAPIEGVITGARGLKAITHFAVRQALIEGSWIARQIWVPAQVGTVGKFDLPMNIQGISTQYLQPDLDLALLGIEQWYWVPPQDVISKVTRPPSPEVGKLMKRLLPAKLVSELQKNNKVALDPALTIHIRNRGNETDSFGESIIQAALQSIAYRRAIDDLDLVSMQNLINRLTIVMVGSADPKSPYSKPEVSAARAALMQSFFTDPGPNMTIIWQGDDVNVKDVGAYNAVLDLNDRHRIANEKIKGALGVPEALLSGTTSDGKSAGWAAMIGSSAEMEELQNSFVQAYTTIGERIATENNFTDLDLIFEFNRPISPDRNEDRTAARQDYTAGVLAIRSVLESMGRDADAEFRTKALEKGLDPDDENVTWEQVFMPPIGLQGQGAGTAPAVPTPPGSGRTPNDSNPNPVKPVPKSKKTPIENK